MTPSHTGITRSSVHVDHALITPESHVPLHLPAWQGVETVVLISAEMGAGFSQYLVTCGAGAQMTPLRPGEEYFLFVLEGTVAVGAGEHDWHLGGEEFAYLASDGDWQLSAAEGSRLLIFARTYAALAGVEAPQSLRGSLAEVAKEPFLGDEGALLQVLLPDDIAFDWGVNVFEFVPGGTLPQVESHFMEHGLYLLDGQGVYRLSDSWYPVQQGDAIWMGPYVLQWFAATGKSNSRYIYYKEMQRAPLG